MGGGKVAVYDSLTSKASSSHLENTVGAIFGENGSWWPTEVRTSDGSRLFHEAIVL